MGEGTTRRGTATPVHRPHRPAGSTHSSTRGLRPPEQLERPAHSYKWAQKQILDKDSICIHMLYWYHCTAKNSLGFPDSICVAQDQSFPMFSLSSVYYYIMIIFYNVLIILHKVESIPHTWAGLLDWFSHGGMRLIAFYHQFVTFILYPTKTSLSLFTFTHRRRKRQPTPVFLPGESQGQGSLVGCCLWGRTESDMTEAT